MPEPMVLVSTQGAVRTLALNRPQALNALTMALHGELLPALQAAAADTAVRAVVLTGTGRGFCAGQDLADPAMVGGVDVGAVIEAYYRPLANRLRSMPVPVIAAVNGVAAGAGPAWRCAATWSSPRAARASSRPSVASAWCRTAAAPGCCRAWWAGPAPWAWR